MDTAHLKSLQAFADQMVKGVTGLQNSIEESMKKSFENISKEDAEKLAAAMKDARVMEIAKESAEKLMELNRNKDI